MESAIRQQLPSKTNGICYKCNSAGDLENWLLQNSNIFNPLKPIWDLNSTESFQVVTILLCDSCVSKIMQNPTEKLLYCKNVFIK